MAPPPGIPFGSSVLWIERTMNTRYHFRGRGGPFASTSPRTIQFPTLPSIVRCSRSVLWTVIHFTHLAKREYVTQVNIHMANTASRARCTDTTPTGYRPLEGIIDTLSEKYAIQIVNTIRVRETLRYGEIRDPLSVASNSILSSRHAELAEVGLITRTHHDEVPPGSSTNSPRGARTSGTT